MIGILLTRLITGEAGVYIARMKRLGTLYGLLAVFVALFLFSLLLAVFILLSLWYGPLAAALGFAAAWLALAVITYIMIVSTRRPAKRADDRLERDIASIAGVATISNLPWVYNRLGTKRSLVLFPLLGGLGYVAWKAFGRSRGH